MGVWRSYAIQFTCILCIFYLQWYECHTISPLIWSNVWIVLPKPSSYIWVLDWVEVFTSHNILQYLCDFYTCSYVYKYMKMPKKSQIDEYNVVCTYLTNLRMLRGWRSIDITSTECVAIALSKYWKCEGNSSTRWRVFVAWSFSAHMKIQQHYRWLRVSTSPHLKIWASKARITSSHPLHLCNEITPSTY